MDEKISPPPPVPIPLVAVALQDSKTVKQSTLLNDDEMDVALPTDTDTNLISKDDASSVPEAPSPPETAPPPPAASIPVSISPASIPVSYTHLTLPTKA